MEKRLGGRPLGRLPVFKSKKEFEAHASSQNKEILSMSEEVKLNPSVEAEKVKARFDELVGQRDQLMKQRSEIDRALNVTGEALLRLQGAYEMAMGIMGKDAAGNALVVPPSPGKEKPKETTVKKKKKK